MRVLIGDKVFDSASIPIMILFNSSECTQFKSTKVGDDIFCSWPSSWERLTGETWMSHNKNKLIPHNEIAGMTEIEKEIQNKIEKINRQKPQDMPILINNPIVKDITKETETKAPLVMKNIQPNRKKVKKNNVKPKRQS